MKKIVKINGKTYVVDTTAGTTEEVATEDVEETTTVEEKVDGLDEAIDAAAEKIMKTLNIEELKTRVEGIEKGTKDSKVSELINFEKLMSKNVSEMTSREKIVGFFQAMVQSNHAVLKALAEGTAADGGYLFPDEFRAEVIRDITETPHMRNEVTVIPMKRDVMKIPTLTNRPIVTWTQENSVKNTTTAAFNEATLTVKKMAAILYASDELIEDSTEIDVVKFIINLFSEVIGLEEDKVITAGNGTTQPQGYATAGTNGTVTCSGNLDFDDLTDLEYALPAKYGRNAKFYAHRNNIREMRKIKDSNGRYLWQDSTAPGQPGTFHGYPVIEDNNLGEDKIFFGDLKMAYWLGDRKSMTVKISNDTETAFTRDQTAIRVVERIAGNLILPNAIKSLISIP